MQSVDVAPTSSIPSHSVEVELAEDLPLGLVYGLPNEAYHKGPGLSNSGAKVLRKTPWHFLRTVLMPRPAELMGERDETEKASLFAGTLCHCATLEPGQFDARYVVGPNARRNSKKWLEFVDAHPNHTVISERQYATAHMQAASIRALTEANEILEGGDCEVSAFWVDAATGVLCKARPDCANPHFGKPDAPVALLLDVKTTTDLSDEAIGATIARYGYHLQAEWYTRGYAAASGVPVAGFIFAFVENEYPFAARCFELDDETKIAAADSNRAAIERYAECAHAKAWPAYPEGVSVAKLPAWFWRGVNV